MTVGIPVTMLPIDHVHRLFDQGDYPFGRLFNAHDYYPEVCGSKLTRALCTLPQLLQLNNDDMPSMNKMHKNL